MFIRARNGGLRFAGTAPRVLGLCFFKGCGFRFAIVRVYDPDTPSFVLEQQDAGLDQALVVLGAAHLVPHGANVAVVGP